MGYFVESYIKSKGTIKEQLELSIFRNSHGTQVSYNITKLNRRTEMHIVREEISHLELEEIADWLATTTEDKINEQAAHAEYLLRQIKLQEQSTKASIETARYTQHSACYLFLTVIVIAVTSVATLIINILQRIV